MPQEIGFVRVAGPRRASPTTGSGPPFVWLGHVAAATGAEQVRVEESPAGGGGAPRTGQLEPARLGDHIGRLYRAAYGLCGSREGAEDLVQDTFERVLRRPRFVRRDQDLAYLMRVLRNTWISSGRARRVAEVPLDDEGLDLAPGGDDPVVARVVEGGAVFDALRALSEPLREAVVAVDVVGLSYREAARALGVKEGTIMSRLHRGRSQMVAVLEDV